MIFHSVYIKDSDGQFKLWVTNPKFKEQMQMKYGCTNGEKEIEKKKKTDFSVMQGIGSLTQSGSATTCAESNGIAIQ